MLIFRIEIWVKILVTGEPCLLHLSCSNKFLIQFQSSASNAEADFEVAAVVSEFMFLPKQEHLQESGDELREPEGCECFFFRLQGRDCERIGHEQSDESMDKQHQTWLRANLCLRWCSSAEGDQMPFVLKGAAVWLHHNHSMQMLHEGMHFLWEKNIGTCYYDMWWCDLMVRSIALWRGWVLTWPSQLSLIDRSGFLCWVYDGTWIWSTHTLPTPIRHPISMNNTSFPRYYSYMVLPWFQSHIHFGTVSTEPFSKLFCWPSFIFPTLKWWIFLPQHKALS